MRAHLGMWPASLLSILLVASTARAGAPSAISVQGVLRDDQGKLQSMLVNVVVTLYDAQQGGKKLAGPYGPTSVMATNGLFTMPIKDDNLASALGPAAEVWMEVAVGNDTFARQQVNSQLFALWCKNADNATVAGTASVAANASVANELRPKDASSDIAVASSDGTTKFATFTRSGAVGVGTATPEANLQVSGSGVATGGIIEAESSSYASITVKGTDGAGINDLAFVTLTDHSGGSTNLAFVGLTGTLGKGAGNVGDFRIAVGGPERLRISKLTGNVTIGGSVQAAAFNMASDLRLKTDIRTIEHPLDGVSKLRGVRFRWKKDGTPSAGVIAQDVEKVLPELVQTAADGTKSVAYGNLVGLLIEAVKELRAENATLRTQLQAQQTRLDRIERRLDQRASR